jgi:hypothetical protein
MQLDDRSYAIFLRTENFTINWQDMQTEPANLAGSSSVLDNAIKARPMTTQFHLV